jgi:hypothetical protein
MVSYGLLTGGQENSPLSHHSQCCAGSSSYSCSVCIFLPSDWCSLDIGGRSPSSRGSLLIVREGVSGGRCPVGGPRGDVSNVPERKQHVSRLDGRELKVAVPFLVARSSRGAELDIVPHQKSISPSSLDRRQPA